MVMISLVLNLINDLIFHLATISAIIFWLGDVFDWPVIRRNLDNYVHFTALEWIIFWIVWPIALLFFTHNGPDMKDVLRIHRYKENNSNDTEEETNNEQED